MLAESGVGGSSSFVDCVSQLIGKFNTGTMPSISGPGEMATMKYEVLSLAIFQNRLAGALLQTDVKAMMHT